MKLLICLLTVLGLCSWVPVKASDELDFDFDGEFPLSDEFQRCDVATCIRFHNKTRELQTLCSDHQTGQVERQLHNVIDKLAKMDALFTRKFTDLNHYVMENTLPPFLREFIELLAPTTSGEAHYFAQTVRQYHESLKKLMSTFDISVIRKLTGDIEMTANMVPTIVQKIENILHYKVDEVKSFIKMGVREVVLNGNVTNNKLTHYISQHETLFNRSHHMITDMMTQQSRDHKDTLNYIENRINMQLEVEGKRHELIKILHEDLENKVGSLNNTVKEEARNIGTLVRAYNDGSIRRLDALRANATQHFHNTALAFNTTHGLLQDANNTMGIQSKALNELASFISTKFIEVIEHENTLHRQTFSNVRELSDFLREILTQYDLKQANGNLLLERVNQSVNNILRNNNVFALNLKTNQDKIEEMRTNVNQIHDKIIDPVMGVSLEKRLSQYDTTSLVVKRLEKHITDVLNILISPQDIRETEDSLLKLITHIQQDLATKLKIVGKLKLDDEDMCKTKEPCKSCGIRCGFQGIEYLSTSEDSLLQGANNCHTWVHSAFVTLRNSAVNITWDQFAVESVP